MLAGACPGEQRYSAILSITTPPKDCNPLGEPLQKLKKWILSVRYRRGHSRIARNVGQALGGGGPMWSSAPTNDVSISARLLPGEKLSAKLTDEGALFHGNQSGVQVSAWAVSIQRFRKSWSVRSGSSARWKVRWVKVPFLSRSRVWRVWASSQMPTGMVSPSF